VKRADSFLVALSCLVIPIVACGGNDKNSPGPTPGTGGQPAPGSGGMPSIPSGGGGTVGGENPGAGGSVPGTGGAAGSTPIDAGAAPDSGAPPVVVGEPGNLGPALGMGNPASMGLDRHDALYCGEWQLTNPGETIYLIKGGKVVWSHAIPDADELGDCTLTSDGHVFFARKTYGAQEIVPDLASGKDGEVVWEYKEDKGTEVHTVQPLGKDKVMIMQNGTPAKLLVIDKTKSKSCTSADPCVVQHFSPPSNGATHGMFRHVRMLANGNILVPFTGGAQNRIIEYKPTSDTEWMPVWQFPKDPMADPITAGSPWAAARLHNGNTLISGNQNNYVREVTTTGEVKWEFTQKDLPADIKFYTVQEAMRLANGNTIINNWCGGAGYAKADWATGCTQVIEVTPDKQIVWKVKQWSNPNLGPGSSTQLLDEAGTPEIPGQLQR
jgi:hypothetical protein